MMFLGSSLRLPLPGAAFGLFKLGALVRSSAVPSGKRALRTGLLHARLEAASCGVPSATGCPLLPLKAVACLAWQVAGSLGNKLLPL